MASWQQSGLFKGISFSALGHALGPKPANELSRADSASTLFRFFRSNHVRDLKLIFAVAFLVFFTHILLALVLGAITAKGSLSSFSSFVTTYIGPAVPIYGIIMGWAYQSASKRLGIVVLFACEISTLCRVGTLLNVGNTYVHSFGGSLETAPASEKFVSQEEYFSVFEHNSRDLELVEAAVVENITKFYTYMKALRDLRRRLTEAKSPKIAESDMQARANDPSGANIIYLLFLGYESAREVVDDLVEFQPDAAERSIVILLTELKCYSFLLKYYETNQDFGTRYKRLKSRKESYRILVAKLYVTVWSRRDEEDYIPARETLPELKEIYQDALGESITNAVARLDEVDDPSRRVLQALKDEELESSKPDARGGGLR